MLGPYTAILLILLTLVTDPCITYIPPPYVAELFSTIEFEMEP